MTTPTVLNNSKYMQQWSIIKLTLPYLRTIATIYHSSVYY